MWGHFTCTYCGDTWFRELDDMEVPAELEGVTIVKDADGITEYIDIDGVMCDGCEDYIADETAAWRAENEYYAFEEE